MDKIVEYLVAYADGMKYVDLPTHVIHEVKRRVIDSFGCAMGAFSEEPCRIVREFALDDPRGLGATVLGTNVKVSPDIAAFVNGTMVRYLDYNDTYLSLEACHPSDNIPAVLAIAENANMNGRDTILGIVVAYEVLCRLADAASIRARGWDHVTYGAISAAVATGRILGLSDGQLHEAIALATIPNIAMRQTRVGEIAMWKACAFANAARNAIFAVLLAAKGLSGPGESFDGVMGFQQQVSGTLVLDQFGGQGRPLMIDETYIKAWPAEYHSQCAIGLALELRTKIKTIEDIEEILIDVYDVAVDIIADTEEKWDPQTRETADHSLPYIVSAALMDGDITPDSFRIERIRDANLLKLVSRVKIRRNKEFSEQYPKAHPVRLAIVMQDGRRFSGETLYALGHPKNPMTDRDVEEKFRRLTGSVLTSKQMDVILDCLWRLEDVNDVGDVLRLFAR